MHLLPRIMPTNPSYVTIEADPVGGLDRRLTWKEVLMRIFGDRPLKTRDELLDEFQKFVAIHKPEPENIV